MKVVGIVKEICFYVGQGIMYFFCKDYYFNSLFELYMKVFYFKNNIFLNFFQRIYESEKKFLKYFINYLKNDYIEE